MPFSTVEKESRKPPAMVLVQPSAFAPTWSNYPDCEVAIGVRPLSEADLIWANGEAVREAYKLYPSGQAGADEAREVVYHDVQMRLVISRGTCDPNDITKVWDGWGLSYPKREPTGGDEAVREALTTAGVKMLWDAIERVSIMCSPIEPQAKDDDIQELLTKAPGALAAMPEWRRARVRRLLHFCLNECLTALGEPGDG